MATQTARGIIFNDDGKILMIERHKGGEHYFVLPGGHVEEGESLQQAVAREIFEETSLAVTVAKELYTSSDDAYDNDQHMFLCNYLGGEPMLRPDSIEAQAMAQGELQQWAPGWFSFDELRDKVVYPAGLLKYLEEDKAGGYHHNPYKIIERRV